MAGLSLPLHGVHVGPMHGLMVLTVLSSAILLVALFPRAFARVIDAAVDTWRGLTRQSRDLDGSPAKRED